MTYDEIRVTTPFEVLNLSREMNCVVRYRVGYYFSISFIVGLRGFIIMEKNSRFYSIINMVRGIVVAIFLFRVKNLRTIYNWNTTFIIT